MALSLGILCCNTALAQSTEPPRGPIRSDQVLFIITNHHPNIVDIEFYSQNRSAAWPGNHKVYSIKDSLTHYYLLNCRRGEKICYGAGVRNHYSLYWGVGINSKHGCTGCCYYCEGIQSKHISLEARS